MVSPNVAEVLLISNDVISTIGLVSVLDFVSTVDIVFSARSGVFSAVSAYESMGNRFKASNVPVKIVLSIFFFD